MRAKGFIDALSRNRVRRSCYLALTIIVLAVSSFQLALNLRGSVQFDLISVSPHKDMKISIQEALEDPNVAVYFLHQRKCGGTTLRDYLHGQYELVLGNASSTKSSAYVPCFSHSCHSYDPNVRKIFSGEVGLFAGHMSFHVPAARSLFGEKQVLITNFRHPSDRVKSCLKFRHADELRSILQAKDKHIERLALLVEKDDQFGDSCAGESIRILTPFNPHDPLSERIIKMVCEYVTQSFHNTFVDPLPNPRRLSSIEAELHDLFSHKRLRMNNDTHSPNEELHLNNFIRFMESNVGHHISEMALYGCVRKFYEN